MGTQAVSSSSGRSGSDDFSATFWQLWEQYRDYLYRCCIKWMDKNPTDAEDALSRAMLKAWEKAQQYAGEIANLKSWLTSLTRNLCVDIHRERSRGANRVEDIEGYARSEEEGLVQSEDTPLCAMEIDEKRIVIRRAIDNLSPRLRETFILYFYQQLSYPEIAQRQEISYQNVCKRISQARKILHEELRGYFIGEEGTDTDKSVPPAATESAIGEISEGNAPVEATVGETVTSSAAVEEVESVVGEESLEKARSSFGITNNSPNCLRNVISFKSCCSSDLLVRFAMQVSCTPTVAVLSYFQNLMTMRLNSHASIVSEGCDRPSSIGQSFYDLKSGSRSIRVSIVSGLCQGKLMAPFTFEGACNRKVFEQWLS